MAKGHLNTQVDLRRFLAFIGRGLHITHYDCWHGFSTSVPSLVITLGALSTNMANYFSFTLTLPCANVLRCVSVHFTYPSWLSTNLQSLIVVSPSQKFNILLQWATSTSPLRKGLIFLCSPIEAFPTHIVLMHATLEPSYVQYKLTLLGKVYGTNHDAIAHTFGRSIQANYGDIWGIFWMHILVCMLSPPHYLNRISNS
jgi:hypothetical protein